MELEQRWPLEGADEVRDRLLAAYGDTARGYHDRLHLAEVLERLDELETAGESFDPVPTRLAAWFHDAVYAGAADDEERSARLAAHELAEAGVADDVVAEVVRLVLVTVDHRPEDGDPNGAALSDADLGILAADPDRYASYVASVRREHAHVGDADFREGRRAVLAALADKPHLFHTAAARERWEQTARANLQRELEHLA